MDAQTLAAKLQQDLDRAEEQFRPLEAKYEAARAQIDKLRREHETLSRIIARYTAPAAAGSSSIGHEWASGSLAASTPVRAPGQDAEIVEGWASGSRTDAIAKALQELGRAATAREIHGHIEKRGRADRFDRVRISLYHLVKTGVVRLVEKGVFALPEPTTGPSVSAEGPVVTPYSAREEVGADADTQSNNHDHEAARWNGDRGHQAVAA